MASCLESWLHKQLGFHVKLDPGTVGEQLFDGEIYTKLLQSYNYAIEYQKLEKAKDVQSALQTLKELCAWFKIIGVGHDDILLRKVANKDGTAALKLLYDLFIALESKDHSTAVYKTRVIQSLNDVPSKFFIEPTAGERKDTTETEARQIEVSQIEACMKLTEPEQIKIAQLFEDSKKRIRQNCVLECLRRRKLAKSRLKVEIDLEKPTQLDIPDFVPLSKLSTLPSKRKMKLGKSADDNVLLTPQQYSDLLRLWRRKSKANELRSTKTQAQLLNTLWKHMIKSQTKEFQESFCSKLLQQSTFEKELASRLNRIHNNYYTFCKNSEIVRDHIEKKENEVRSLEDSFKVLVEMEEEEYEERRRVYELHRRLYDEKAKKKRELIREMCYDTAQDIINFALKCIDFKETFNEKNTETNNEPIPRKILNEWKELFYEGLYLGPKKDYKSSFKVGVITIEDEDKLCSEEKENKVVIDLDLEEEGEKDDDIYIRLDQECGEYLIDQILSHYLYLTGPWYYESFLSNLDLLEPELYITGYIVHRLLETKYPLPESPLKADLPDYGIKAIVTPWTETSVTNKLKQLLNNYRVILVDVPAATNYCIEVYKKEKHLTKIGQSLREKVEDVKKESDVKKKSVKKKEEKPSKGKKTKKKPGKGNKKEMKKKKKPSETVIIEKVEKAIQVPSITEIHPVGHTRAGLLGKLAFEVLHGGRKLTDIHIVNMLTEYLKSLEGIRGWVLLNYPHSFQQAALLEYIIGGNQIQIPNFIIKRLNLDQNKIHEPYIDSNALLEFERKLESLGIPLVGKMMSEEIDGEIGLEASFEEEETEDNSSLPTIADDDMSIRQIIELRTSKILPRPNKLTYFAEGVSYFKKFINLLSKTRSSLIHTTPVHHHGYLSEAVIDPYLYYNNLGIAERILLTNIDYNFIKHIVFKITNETELLRDLSASGTGSSAKSVSTLSSLASSNLENYIPKSGFPKPSNVNNNNNDGQVELFGELDEEENLIMPGDADWKYVELPIPINFQKSLATMWEAVEFTYLYNLKETFLNFRNIDKQVVPYKLFIRRICEQCINKPDNKQTIITNYQLMYNYILDEVGVNEDIKVELHCRLYELYNELCQISAEKKEIAEATKRGIIRQNWVAHQAYSLVNVAINIVQIELDRYIDSLQILYDYYIASLQKLPVEKRLEKVSFKKVSYPDGEDLSKHTIDKTKTKILKPSKVKPSSLSSVPHNIELLLLNDEVGSVPNPTHLLLVGTVDSVIQNVKNIKSHYDNIIINEYKTYVKAQLERQHQEEINQNKILEEVRKMSEPEQPKRAKEKIKKTKKRPKSPTGPAPTVDDNVSAQKEFKINLEDIIVDFKGNKLEDPFNSLLWEWSKGLEDETNRILFRVNLIVRRFKIDLDELIDIMKDTFREFTREIIVEYRKEMKNIHTIVDLFKVAIEENQVLKPLIALDNDGFYVDMKTIIYPDIPPPPPTPLTEPINDYEFTVEQLTRIMDKLNYTAPEGIIEESFINILEDMAVLGRECGEPFLPEGWLKLTNADFRSIVSSIFRESAVIDWRDFLIFGLNIPFPSIAELLDARQQITKFDPEENETITWPNFEKVTLWFDNVMGETLEHDLRLLLIKEFLFKLYRINKQEMNYAAMLLAFCRSRDQADGFAKALSLVSGKPYVTTARDLYKCRDEFYLESPDVVEYILNLLIAQVINIKEGVYIRELSGPVQLDHFDWYSNELDLSRIRKLERKKEQKKDKNVKLGLKDKIERSIWVSLVPYDMALTIILYYLHFHPLSKNHLYRGFRLAEELKQLYIDKGRWNVIRALDLVDSEFMRCIFNSTGCFRAINLPLKVKKMVESKEYIIPILKK